VASIVECDVSEPYLMMARGVARMAAVGAA